jgi:sirohydrochlorin cobaltochelatase
VGNNDFSDAALLLFGHGSTLNADSGASVFQHATELRRRRCFAKVYEGFWKQEPRVLDVLPKITAPRVFLAPLFMSEGYFSEGVIPRALGFPDAGRGETQRVVRRRSQVLIYCRAIGTHPQMTEVLLARAKGVVQQFPFPRAPRPKEITLFVAGHGTEQHEDSRAAVERQVDALRGLTAYAAVHGIFLEEKPLISACYRLARTKNIVLVPFFVSEGMHAREDIPVLLGEPKHLVQQRLRSGQPAWRNPCEKQGKLVWCAASAGTEPAVAEVICERVREAAAWV